MTFDEAAAQSMYEDDGLSFAEIGRRLGVGHDKVRNACYANGAKPRKNLPAAGQRPQIAGRRPSAHAFDHDEAIRMYEVEHLSFMEIGRRLGVTDKSVREACYKAGVAKPREAKNQRAAQMSNMQLVQRFAALTVDDPTVRVDGCCHVCLEPRRAERSATYAPGCAELDAFCSTECAREFHGNPIPVRPSHPNAERSAA